MIRHTWLSYFLMLLMPGMASAGVISVPTFGDLRVAGLIIGTSDAIFAAQVADGGPDDGDQAANDFVEFHVPPALQNAAKRIVITTDCGGGFTNIWLDGFPAGGVTGIEPFFAPCFDLIQGAFVDPWDVVASIDVPRFLSEGSLMQGQVIDVTNGMTSTNTGIVFLTADLPSDLAARVALLSDPNALATLAPFTGTVEVGTPITVRPIPEPASIALIGVGLSACLLARSPRLLRRCGSSGPRADFGC